MGAAHPDGIFVPSFAAREFEGIAAVEKRVILYGSESNVSIFRSNPDAYDYCTPCPRRLPRKL